MQCGLLTIFCPLVLALGLSACSGTFTVAPRNDHASTLRHVPSQDNQLRQDQWQKRNYPNRAAYLDELPTAQTFFRDDVLAGHIQLGMTLEETLIATSTTPYGPKRFKGKFWCDNQVVARCNRHCKICNGIVFINNQPVFFNGISQPPTVVDLDEDPKTNSIFSSAPHSLKYQIAEALYRNKIVNGMSLDEVLRVIAASNTEAQYFCGNQPLNATELCDKTCKTCRIETNRALSASKSGKIIYLELRDGEPRVTGIQSMTNQ